MDLVLGMRIGRSTALKLSLPVSIYCFSIIHAIAPTDIIFVPNFFMVTKFMQMAFSSSTCVWFYFALRFGDYLPQVNSVNNSMNLI